MNLRADLYQFLAEALSEPPEWFALRGSKWPLYEIAAQLAPFSTAAGQAVSEMETIPAEPVSVRLERYRALISGCGGRQRIDLYESLHKSGRLAGPETFAVLKAYQNTGLAIQSAELPDHASLELAFLAFLAARDPRANFSPLKPGAEERRFLRQHAGGWLQVLGKQLIRSNDLVYGPVGFLLAGWIADCMRPRIKTLKRGLLPVLQEPGQCTLCGFCSQVCPTGAIALHENDEETRLTLQPSGCTGCIKCIRVCAAGVLGCLESEQTERSNVRQTLLSSPRIQCQLCAAPMVSLAEMNYMVSILGEPKWLGVCPDCRPNVIQGEI